MRIVYILPLVFAFLSSQEASAAFCLNGHPSVEAEYKQAKYVVVARLKSTEENVFRQFVYKGVRYREKVRYETVIVRKWFKGRAPKFIRFLDTYDSARFSMDRGVDYLVFFNARPNGNLYVDVCGHSTRLDRVSPHDLLLVRRLSGQE